MTPEEYKTLREGHTKCSPANTVRHPQKTAGRVAEGRCHMPNTQCIHINEYSCTQCGFGWAEETGHRGVEFT